MAGVLPGILLSIVYAIGIYLIVLIRPQLGGKRPDLERLSWSSISRMIFKPWGVVALVCLVLGGMYLGFFTPTEAGAIGSFGAFLLALIKRKLNRAILWATLLETGYITASIFLLLITAQMYSQMLTISGLAAKSSEFISSLSLAPIVIILMFVLVFLALGSILDSTSILLVCIPLMIPSVKILGFNMIWFGIVAVMAVEMGLVTPPFGMVGFAMKSVLMDEATIEDIFAGSVPFLIMMFLVLILVIIFPWISTWLPSLM